MSNDQHWFDNKDQLHRLDGPAIIWSDGEETWGINGRNITADVLEWISENSLPDWKEWSSDDWVLFSLRFR